MEFMELPVGDLEVMAFNPNEMDKGVFEHLKAVIAERGFQQPLTVAEAGDGKYAVVDGAHRLKAVKELGWKVVPCWVVGSRELRDIKVDLINLNRTRGEFDPVKFAALLEGLSREIPAAELARLTGMESEDLMAAMNAKWEGWKYREPDVDPGKLMFEHECRKCGYRW